MAKSSGGTRASASNNPRGLNTTFPSRQTSSRLEQQEEIAERFYANGELTVDPGDAVYANIRSLSSDKIADSIENMTDYDVLPEVARGGDTIALTILPRYSDTADLIQQYGADSFRIPLQEQSLMDVIQELRSSSMGSLFGRYR